MYIKYLIFNLLLILLNNIINNNLCMNPLFIDNSDEYIKTKIKVLFSKLINDSRIRISLLHNRNTITGWVTSPR